MRRAAIANGSAKTATAGAFARVGRGQASVWLPPSEILLEREGWQVNHKRMYRLYVEEKLSLRRKRGRKRSTVRQPLPAAVAANQVWSVDFMSDTSVGTEVSYLEHRG